MEYRPLNPAPPPNDRRQMQAGLLEHYALPRREGERRPLILEAGLSKK